MIATRTENGVFPTKTRKSDFKLHFGKWRGRPLSQVPCSYLQWVLINSRHLLNPPLARAIVQELEGTFLPGDSPLSYYTITKANYEKYHDEN